MAVGAVLVALAVWLSPSSTPKRSLPLGTAPATSAPRPVTTTTVATTDGTDASETTSPGDTVVVDPSTGAVAPTGYLLDPAPDGLVPSGAGQADTTESPTNWFELWAAPDARRTSGRWFAVLAVDTTDFAPPDVFAAHSKRVDVSGFNGLLTLTDDGVRRLTVEVAGRQQISWEASGDVSDDELVGLAADTTFGDGNRPVYGDASRAFFDGLDLQVSRATTQSVLDYQVITGLTDGVRASYESPDGRQFVSVLVGDQQPNDITIGNLLASASTDDAAAFAPDRTITINGQLMHTGRLQSIAALSQPGAPPFQYIAWHQGGRTVMIIGLVGLDVLFDAARSARPANADEWERLHTTSPITVDQTNDDPGPSATGALGQVTTTSGISYDVTLIAGASTTLAIDEQRVADPSSTGSSPFDGAQTLLAVAADPAHPLIEVNSREATAVVVIFDHPPSASNFAVTVGGQQHVVPIVQVGDGSLYGAAYVFSERADYTAAVVGPDGTAVATLDH
ncbi:MAG: hypothetical protein JWM34_4230 [Ilumatobacteraceae bacterium]|nr:hypothetical protein [Ilumatobacteraceae bacterium]